MATNPSTTPVSGNSNIDPLLLPAYWSDTLGSGINLTYSIPKAGTTYWSTNYGDNEQNTAQALSTDQANNFRLALESWSDIANITFTEVPDESTYGSIRIAFTTMENSTAGYAYSVNPRQESAEAADIWLNKDLANESFTVGTSNYNTLLHEIGHALGLDHPFEANETNGARLTSALDSSQHTLMSYTAYNDNGNYYVSENGSTFYLPVQPSSPMLLDIQAIQYMYGANMSTRTGDDTYTFSNSEGELKTIWDAGGIDTFDLSNQTYANTINLNAGEFSSLGIKKTSNSSSGNQSAVDNIAIAYNVTIENAIGGQGDDIIAGNSADNELQGGLGNDILDGGAGNDTAVYTENFSAITSVNSLFNNGILLNGSFGQDSLSNIESIRFADTGTLSLSEFLNRFSGDTPTPTDEPTEPPSNNDDFISAVNTSGTLSVNGSTAGNIETGRDTDWFRISLQAGQEIQIDLEGSPTNQGSLTDTYLNGIYNSGGTLIANTSNDDGGTGTNAQLNFTALSDGDYFISAGAYDTEVGTYQLTANLRYELINDAKTFVNARADAVNKGGQLLQIDTIGENDFIYQLLLDAGVNTQAPDGGDAVYAWLGATDEATEDTWLWSDNSAINSELSAWATPTEPDNFTDATLAPDGQDYAAIALTGWSFGEGGQWNDLSGQNQLAYIVEYNVI